MSSSPNRVTAVLAASETLRSVPELELMVEIERYLEAVALFRALGHEPAWQEER